MLKNITTPTIFNNKTCTVFLNSDVKKELSRSKSKTCLRFKQEVSRFNRQIKKLTFKSFVLEMSYNVH